MGRGGQIYLSYTALVLLSRACGTVALDWSVHIDNNPAPPPELSPPFSANALRDPAWLPYQIVGIVGSYVVTVFVIGTLIVLVGQPARRRAQMLSSGKSKEMVKPFRAKPKVISPQDQPHWYSPSKLGHKKNSNVSITSLGSTVMSPSTGSVLSFDASVIEADKARRAAEMEQLYAAVMADDDRINRNNAVVTNTQAVSEDYLRKAPPRLITDAPGLRHLRTDSHHSPKSPGRVTYPSDKAAPPLPYGPTSPGRVEYPYAPYSGLTTQSSHSSFGSPTTPSTPNRKIRKSMKNIKISSPILMRNDDNEDGARTPLTPRVYFNPGVPPEPPVQVPTLTVQEMTPTTPRTPATTYYYNNRHSDTPTIIDDYEAELMDEVRDLPSANPHRSTNFSQPLRIEPQSPQPLRQKTSASPIASVNNQLPFRQFLSQHQQQQQQSHVPVSAGPIKTTFVESSRDRLAAGTPRTGMATPYSAYMPFTPLTPVTPHIASRSERKQRKKEERSLQGAITEEDQVRDEKELWDSGY